MLKITIETDVETRIVDFTASEQKAFEYIANMPIDWIENALRNRCRQAVDQIVDETTNKNPKKTDVTEKLQDVVTANIESAAKRHAKAIKEK